MQTEEIKLHHFGCLQVYKDESCAVLGPYFKFKLNSSRHT